tara:strand:- start:30 stop:332 length:303 start_codon:yes stop_codon:yes gene_type:complete
MASAAHIAIISLGVIARPEQRFILMVFLHQVTWTICHASLTYLVDSAANVKCPLQNVAVAFLDATGCRLIWLTWNPKRLSQTRPDDGRHSRVLGPRFDKL